MVYMCMMRPFQAHAPSQAHCPSFGSVPVSVRFHSVPGKAFNSRRSFTCSAAFSSPASVHHTPDSVEDDVGDYMEMLRGYRRLQQRLGPVAVLHARSLLPASSASNRVYDMDWPAWKRQLNEAAEAACVRPDELHELVAMRRRLLHDLPRVKARVKAERSTTSTNMMQQGKHTSPGAVNAGSVAGQWVRAQQYKHNHKSTAPQDITIQLVGPSGALSPVSDTPTWINRLGFGDMVDHSPQVQTTNIPLQPIMINRTELVQQLAGMQASTSQGSNAPAKGVSSNTSQSVSPSPHAVDALAEVQSTTPPTLPASLLDTSLTPATDQQQLSTGNVHIGKVQVLNPPTPSTPAVRADGHDSASVSLQPPVNEPPAAAAAHQADTGMEAVVGAPSRLRSAMLAALKYKKAGVSSSSSTPSPVSSSMAPSSLDAVPKDYQGLTVNETVEVAKFDVYAAPSRSRADPDEAALQLCP